MLESIVLLSMKNLSTANSFPVFFFCCQFLKYLRFILSFPNFFYNNSRPGFCFSKNPGDKFTKKANIVPNYRLFSESYSHKAMNNKKMCNVCSSIGLAIQYEKLVNGDETNHSMS